MGRAVIVQSLLIKTYADSPFPISRLELLPLFESSRNRNLNITASRTEIFRRLYKKNSNPELFGLENIQLFLKKKKVNFEVKNYVIFIYFLVNKSYGFISTPKVWVVLLL